jgi:hypothetical protein
LLKELAEIETSPEPGPALADRLAALLEGRRPPSRRGLDVDDPMGLGSGAYLRCLEELEAGVFAIADLLGSKA